MAGKKENLKALFTNTRTRVIIIFTAIVLIVAVVIGVTRFTTSTALNLQARVSEAPGGIRSIPGTADPSAEYAALVQTRNVQQAEKATKTGGSAIPTIIRTQAFGEGVDVIGPQQGKGAVGFTTLAMEDAAGTQRSLWLQSLQEENCSQSVVQKVVSQGATLDDLKAACSCAQLKDNGYSLQELIQVCSCKELKATGVNARDLKNLGYSARRLRDCGFNACELYNAGFTAQEMKDAGFSDDELKGAGFSAEDIARASGLPDGITAQDVRNAGCDATSLQRLRSAGVSAAAIRRINGCSAAQLKAAGYNAQELRNAGFSAADLKNAGFTPAELRAGGYNARDLLNAGFSTDELAQAGFTPQEISAAEANLPPGVTLQAIKASGCDPETLRRERLAGVSAKVIRQQAGCSADALKSAGFTDNDLLNAGFSPDEVRAARVIDPDADTEVSDDAVRAAGCDPQQLRSLMQQGVSAKRIRDLNNCSVDALKAAGFDAKDLADAGFTPEQLLAAGFTPEQLNRAGLNPSGVIATGRTTDCSVESLKAARAMGVTAETIKETLGCDANAMKQAGYTADELRAAGFTAAELKAAGFTPEQLKQAGYTADELRAAGFSAEQLKDAGFTAEQLREAGFSAAELKNAGFSAAQLKAAGFQAKDLKDAGFSARELRNAGFTVNDLKDAGFTASQLKNAGFSDQELQDAGFTPPGAAVAGLEERQETTRPTTIPGIAGAPRAPAAEQQSTQQLQEILRRQQKQMASQEHEQEVQQRMSLMQSAATSAVQEWSTVSTQVYIEGTEPQEASAPAGALAAGQPAGPLDQAAAPGGNGGSEDQKAVIKTGDVIFAVLDTTVNSDEPSPILATIVSGKLKGTKLIGSFTLPSNADKLVISFNTMSVPGAAKTTSISAYAIDPNTARTALSSRTNHHYLMRYGSLFASTFLQGFGNAFQSANTTITIGGGAGGVQSTTVESGIGRSILENAVIGLATLGKSWSQVAQQNFNRPTTVEVCSGTGLGVLFTQDVTSI